jgi:osmotically-inducible protein OsmY
MRSLFLSLAIAIAAIACNADDTTLTVRVQSRVNQGIDPYSSVDVMVHDGVATLGGFASSDGARARALDIARSVEGIREVRDEIKTPPPVQTTGAAAPTKEGSRPAPSP